MEKIYSYKYSNVQKLKDPLVLNPNMYRSICKDGKEFFDIAVIYVFKSENESYWHICFSNGNTGDYRQKPFRYS